MFVAASTDVEEEDASEIVGPDAGLSLVPGAGAKAGESARTLAPADLRHPLFLGLGTTAGGLGLVKFTRPAVLKAACETLARFTTGETALADCAPGDGHVVFLAADLDGRTNDFPRRALFVPFVHEAVRYLAGARSRVSERLVGSGVSGAAKPGIVTLNAPAGAAGASGAAGADGKPDRKSTRLNSSHT